ncbi:MAG: peptidylprolyl isomerase, partial [Nitrospinota bacterium]
NLREQFGDNINQSILNSFNIDKIAINSLIDNRLLQRSAANLGITVSDEEARNTIFAMEQFQNEQGKFDPSKYSALLAQVNISKSQYEQSVRETVAIDRLRRFIEQSASVSEGEIIADAIFNKEKVKAYYSKILFKDFESKVDQGDDKLAKWYESNSSMFEEEEERSFKMLSIDRKKIATTINVTDEQAKEYYDANISSDEKAKEVKASHILIKVDKNSTEEEIAAAKSKIEAIYKEVTDGGANFSKVAKEKSEDSSKSDGGNLGYFGKGVMVPKFEQVAFTLEKDQISKPFQTDFGFHIVKVVDKKGFNSSNFDQRKIEIKSIIKNSIAAEKGKKIINDILFEVLPDNFGSFADKDKNLTINSMTIRKGDTPTDSLVNKAVYAAVFELKPDEISEMIEINNRYAILILDQIKERQVPDLANIREEVLKNYIEDSSKELAKTKSEEFRDLTSDKTDLKAVLQSTKFKVSVSPTFARDDISKLRKENKSHQDILFNELFNLDTGEAKVKSIQDGYLIYQLIERVPLEPLSVAEKSLIKERLLSTKRQSLYKIFVEQMRNEAEKQGEIVINLKN